MHINSLKAMIKTAVWGAAVLLLGTGAAAAQSVSLTAGPATATLPDGNSVPMWGYTCGAVVAPAKCAPLNRLATAPGVWSPVVITVPTGSNLTINLTNKLSFGANNIPTSIMIVGQIGGGLGDPTQRTTTISPSHSGQGVTWPIANTGDIFTPPTQPARVQSFGTEVQASAAGTLGTLTWSSLRPGTYLLESGTHPSIQVPMGLVGMLVVTTAPTAVGTTGTAYPASGGNPAFTYSTDVPLELGEIDPVQNRAVDTAVRTAGFAETKVWSGLNGQCGDPKAAVGVVNTCYPPAVDYSPLYFTINGVAFNKTVSTTSEFFGTFGVSTGITGNVLVRLVNAGSKMHVPAIVQTTTTVPTAPLTSGGAQGSKTVQGFRLVAEDGNPIPGLARVQDSVFMPAGKTFDVAYDAFSVGFAVPVYDRELSLSGNKINRDAGMLGYISVNGKAIAASPDLGAAVARPDTYAGLLAGKPFTVSDPSVGVLANDTNVYGAKLLTAPTHGTVVLNPDGTFTYTPSGALAADSFTYGANGTTTITATVTLNAAVVESAAGISCLGPSFSSTMATYIKIPNPGLLQGCKDALGYPLTVVPASVTPAAGLTMVTDPAGGFMGSVAAPGTFTFTYLVQNAQGTQIAGPVTGSITFPIGSGLAVNLVDGKTGAAAPGGTDFRWIIEEDKSFYIDPNCTTNTGLSRPANCANTQLPSGTVPILGTNFHTSDMTYVASGCTGPNSCESGQTVLGVAAACDQGNGVCRTTATQRTAVFPSAVHLDPTKRYYISVLPGDAADPFINGSSSADCSNHVAGATGCGYSMGGANVGPGQLTVNVTVETDPYPPSDLSVSVFEDDFPLNGEQDAGGQILDTSLGTQEPGLGGFNIVLWDDMGGSGDPTGQMTYDMFNQPLSNSLDGTIDPLTGANACPITKQAAGIVGVITVCPTYESDKVTLSPLGGQAVVKGLMPGRFSVQAIPGADRIARGELWLQTNTLDGQKAHDSFLRIGEPGYFQEFGPAGYHVAIGFANPGIINKRKTAVCAGTDPELPITGGCPYTIMGTVTDTHLSRTPDQRLYSSGSHDAFSFTQCYISLGDPDGEDFAFTYCDGNGHFQITGVPPGNWRLTTFDEWNDLIVDGLSTPVGLSLNTTTGKLTCPGPATTATVCDMGDAPAQQWHANLITHTFFDTNRNGVLDPGEGALALISTNVRMRDGSLQNANNTDFTGTAPFNETFPLFNWYVVETDYVRYKTTGIHVVYDAGGPVDGSAACGVTGYPPCGGSSIGANLANTAELVSLPTNLRVPGAVYCASADCTGKSIASGPASSDPPSSCTTTAGATTCSTLLSTGRIDPPWVTTYGWQGYTGQNNFLDFGKIPYAANETGPIFGHVVYHSTRPFDDPALNVQLQWEPGVPNVTVNLYQEGLAADGVTQTLTLVDRTTSASFDGWAQGFRSDGVPNMNCPGQSTQDLFYFSLLNQPFYLDWYNKQHAVPDVLNTLAVPTALPNNSQFKCYDGMHNWNQLQPAPYDGQYSFPSVLNRNPTTGNTTGTNCTICVKDNDPLDTFRFGKEDMLPPGKYVVEVVPPPGFEIDKEEDKNILIGDNFIAPVTQQFGGLGDIFILPDQASISSNGGGSGVNGYNAQNPTQNLGTTPTNEFDPSFPVEQVWPCVGDTRIVPDYISLFPQSLEVAPFAGATRNLCDRKEVTLNPGNGAIAKFYIFTPTHKAAKFTGVITDDFTSEFDPFSPQFGEKFAPPNMPISIKDWTGTEISRVYSDWWGDYNGLTFSTWEVNPPNPTGYSPTMMVFCMNDKGPMLDTRSGSPTLGQMITDPLYNLGYSQFCYELPFMPGQAQYLDTPVVPTSSFSDGYNHPDCSYPDATPSISSVTGPTVAGPWVSAAGQVITINSLPDQQIVNNGYVGPQASAIPYNAKTTNRHFGFGATAGTVTIGGKTATVNGWSDTQITAVVPTGIPNCAVQQQSIYGGSTAQCGQLVITSAGGQQSIDTVTITVGGKTPTVVTGTAPMTVNGPGSVQQAIDAAKPGDMLIIPPGTHKEILIMWKPIRLQGVGAASSIIDGNAHPAGVLDGWRRQVACLFGISINGRPISGTNPFDVASDTANNGGPFTCPTAQNFAIDRMPLEATVGWDATLNGNLAELLQEPTLMGSYEGAGITVLGKGVKFPAGQDPFGSDIFPVGTTLLTGGSAACLSGGANPFPSNFQCNPSSIDGLAITDSSQGGGGIFAHGWNHNLQVSNNRVYGNTGTLTGGINIGQGEFPTELIQGSTTNPDPPSCVQTLTTNQQQPYCFNLNTNVHHNMVTNNSSIGDELFSGTLSGAGGVAFCTGSDFYKFNFNWVCGNFSAGEGGGFTHLGFIFNGDIEHNTIIFNQSLNPTIPTNGGGIMIEGAPDTDPICGTGADQDCAPGTSDGTGPGLVINANLIQGNAAEAGSGGGIRLQGVNGVEVTTFPKTSALWYAPSITNNIIVNNVAGWDGGGVSLEDALAVKFINNTVASNDSTATAGILFNTLGAPLASSQTPGTSTFNGTTSLPQPAGFVTMQNSVPLTSSLAGVTLTCPGLNPNCQLYSNPYLANNVFWQNRSYYVGVGALSNQFQQNLVNIYNASYPPVAAGSIPANQTTTGLCVAGSSYWDLGVRGDTAPGVHSKVGTATLQLSPIWSLLTNTSEAGVLTTTHNKVANPGLTHQYCNGSRVPPEFQAGTWNVPPGIADATVPNPLFNLAASATVDEGNNWVNLTWGPLSLTNPTTTGTDGNYGGGAMIGIYTPASAASATVDAVTPCPGTCTTPGVATNTAYTQAPGLDFFGHTRPDGNRGAAGIDMGAVEWAAVTTGAPTITSISPNSGTHGTVVNVTITGTNLAGTTSVTGNAITVTNLVVVDAQHVTATFTIGANATLGARNVQLTASGQTALVTFTVN